jgi:Regulator of chromosome condensation (RCC1) repeat
MARWRTALALLVGITLVACGSTSTPARIATGAPAPRTTGTPRATLRTTATRAPTVTPVPTPAPTVTPPSASAVIAAGGWHTCVVLGEGGVRCWGLNDSGQLGGGTPIQASLPVGVPGLEHGVAAITSGDSFSCALTDAGGVQCWGSNAYGQLGDGTTDDSAGPVGVSGLDSGVTAIAAGAEHACALTAAGGVKCWGLNYDGELGDGTTTDSPVPVDVAGLTSGVSAIAASSSYTCAITSGGGTTCWGSYEPDLPGRIDDQPADLVAIATGGSCELTISGGVQCWDSLEDGSVFTVDVAGLATGVKAITEGYNHACALTGDNGVRCWGSNDTGQIGVASVAESSIPVEVDFSGRRPTLDASGAIEHPTGQTDVVLRYDHGPDHFDLMSEFADASFQPGPEFTLYGDGTIIFRDETAQAAPSKGGIKRAGPFRIARLPESQVQSLLRFALDEAGLRLAISSYDTGGEGCWGGTWTYTLHVVGLDERVESGGCGDALGLLAEHLRGVAAASTSDVWTSERHWASLLRARTLVKRGALSRMPATTVPWPWPDLTPADFAWSSDDGLGREGRRVMPAEEASVLGLSDDGGVVRRVYLLGPDGTTVYHFSLWPASPDETGQG